MFGSRSLTALAGLIVSIALSVLLWLYFQTLLVFLFLPFVPFLFRGLSDAGTDRTSQPPARECPQCGFRSTDPGYEYCPRDGRRLDEPRRNRYEEPESGRDGWQ